MVILGCCRSENSAPKGDTSSETNRKKPIFIALIIILGGACVGAAVYFAYLKGIGTIGLVGVGGGGAAALLGASLAILLCMRQTSHPSTVSVSPIQKRVPVEPDVQPSAHPVPQKRVEREFLTEAWRGARPGLIINTKTVDNWTEEEDRQFDSSSYRHGSVFIYVTRCTGNQYPAWFDVGQIDDLGKVEWITSGHWDAKAQKVDMPKYQKRFSTPEELLDHFRQQDLKKQMPSAELVKSVEIPEDIASSTHYKGAFATMAQFRQKHSQENAILYSHKEQGFFFYVGSFSIQVTYNQSSQEFSFRFNQEFKNKNLIALYEKALTTIDQTPWVANTSTTTKETLDSVKKTSLDFIESLPLPESIEPKKIKYTTGEEEICLEHFSKQLLREDVTHVFNSSSTDTDKIDRLKKMHQALPFLLQLTYTAPSSFPVIGIPNYHGNNCFLNATLQAWAHTQAADYLLLRPLQPPLAVSQPEALPPTPTQEQKRQRYKQERLHRTYQKKIQEHTSLCLGQQQVLKILEQLRRRHVPTRTEIESVFLLIERTPGDGAGDTSCLSDCLKKMGPSRHVPVEATYGKTHIDNPSTFSLFSSTAVLLGSGNHYKVLIHTTQGRYLISDATVDVEKRSNADIVANRGDYQASPVMSDHAWDAIRHHKGVPTVWSTDASRK